MNEGEKNLQLKSRRIKLSIDDRKYIPVLDFDGPSNQIILGVKNTSIPEDSKKFNEFIQLRGNDGVNKPKEIVGINSHDKMAN